MTADTPQFWLTGFGLLFGLALLLSAGGFYRVVYFISIGYTLAIIAMAVAGLIVWRDHFTWAVLLQAGVLILWGARLGFYIILRESKTAYQREKQSADVRDSAVNFGQKLLIWVSVCLLYACMFAPCWFALATAPWAAPTATAILSGIGATIMVAGFLIEAFADQQKSAFKAQNPTKFCTAGLYQWVRCPNYWGEILVWVGNWVMGIPFYQYWWQWVVSIIGLVCIVLIMIGSTKRLEHEQGKRYGQLTEYQAYIRRVPVLVPWVPLYTLQHVRVYLE